MFLSRNSEAIEERLREQNARFALQVLSLLLLSLLGGEEHPPRSRELAEHRQLTGLVFAWFSSTLFHLNAFGWRGVAYAAETFFPLPCAFLPRARFPFAETLEALDGWRWLARGYYAEASMFEECRKLMALAERDGEPALEHAIDYFGGVLMGTCTTLGESVHLESDVATRVVSVVPFVSPELFRKGGAL